MNPRTALVEDGDDWVQVTSRDLRILCRRHISDQLLDAYDRHCWIYNSLMDRKDTVVLRGRHPVLAGSLGDHRLVIKRLYHGGLLARIVRDAFLTSSRAREHVALADYLESHGIATPRVLFVSWRRVFGLVRCEIGFDQIDGADDADRYFFSQSRPPQDWEARACQVGALVARLHSVRILHTDLNLMNFLFARDGQTYILDLDKTNLPDHVPSDADRTRNLNRLERSIRKQGRKHLSSVVDSIVGRVRSSYRESFFFAHAAVGLDEMSPVRQETAAIEQLTLL